LLSLHTPSADYYDTTTQQRIAADTSQNDLIKFATASIKASLVADGSSSAWQESWLSTVWVTEADEAKFPSLKAGDAYYITTSVMNDNGLTWDIVVVQKVACLAGYFANNETLLCEECVSPFWSGGNAPVVCDQCIKDYFYKTKSASCKKCPDGALCDGATPESKMDIQEGYWRSSKTSSNVYECPLGVTSCAGGNISKSNGYCNEGYEG